MRLASTNCSRRYSATRTPSTDRTERVANRTDRTEQRQQQLKQLKSPRAFEPGTARAKNRAQSRSVRLWR
eukprot:12860828-Alexandrium_andersonii.AAC.1